MSYSIAIKKQVSKVLVNEITGSVISNVFSRIIPFRGTKIEVPKNISSTICAMLFFNTYESAEIRFVKKYINDGLDVVEIGSSLGGVSCQIGKKLLKSKLICVEANPTLIPTLKKNLQQNNISAIVFNKAIGIGPNIEFVTSDNNLIGHDDTNSENFVFAENTVQVETVSLEELRKQFSMENFNLVCDIEGAEIVLLKETPMVFQNVKNLVIELHTTTYEKISYSVQELVKLIEIQGFEVVDSYGNVYVFKNTKFDFQ